MKSMVECADQYIRQCRVKDFTLLKICLCAIGIIIGLMIPEKKRKWPLAAAACIFVFSYILLMAEFVKIYMEGKYSKLI